MHVTLRLPLLSCVLLLAAAPHAWAESPLPDPVPPAVIGRPLDQIQPARPVRAKPPAAKPAAPRPQAAAAGQAPSSSQHQAKQALDDRADPRMQMVGVGTGTHFARKPLGPGAYFGDRHRAAVRKYYGEHPGAGPAVNWRIGEPVPRGAALGTVPRGLLGSLPPVPPGHRYVELGGEVVLMASGSKMVVDGISRRPR